MYMIHVSETVYLAITTNSTGYALFQTLIKLAEIATEIISCLFLSTCHDDDTGIFTISTTTVKPILICITKLKHNKQTEHVQSLCKTKKSIPYTYIQLYTLERKCSYIDFYKLSLNQVWLALNIPLISKTHQN